jgi:large subunit ribosomal protein L32
MRRSHDHVRLPRTTLCPQCHEPVLPHRVCAQCGSYKGQTLIETEES